MDSEHDDAARIVDKLYDTNLVGEGEEESHVAPVDPASGRPSTDAQNYEVVHSPEPEPRAHDETSNNDNGGSLVVVEDQPAPATETKVVDETPSRPPKELSPRAVSPRVGEAQTSLIQVQLQIDASMDNDELEAVRQTMTFVLGFYRKLHEEHYHRNKSALDFGRAARTLTAEVPKTDECMAEFHAKVEGMATTYAARLAHVVMEIEPILLAKAALSFQKLSIHGDDKSEEDIWLEFRKQADSLFKAGESWEKFVIVLLLAYLVCLSEEVRNRQRATGFLRLFIQYLVAERHIRWVARHGGWANAGWGLRRQRLAKWLCAKSTLYGFLLISIGVAAVGIFLTKKQHR